MSQDPEKLPIIKLGQENAPVLIDLKKDDETSLFSSVYNEAYDKIEEYIIKIAEREDSYIKNRINPLYRNENFNNIFAFCGERGSGKTSCMQTVAYNINYRFESKYKFEVLDIIDPSFFDSTHNILELVISQLFKKFTKKLEQLPCHCNDHESIQNKKRLLIKQFQTVKENITNLEAKCDPDETIESLAKLSASMDLGKSIHDLVDKYLEFSDKSNFLVIQIDDIDLNTEHAYKMIEQIRKYLIQSNIIILMAAKLEQLNDVIKLDYQIKFEKLIQAKMMNGDISDYADKYLAKLIPDTKRIYLPNIQNVINRNVEIKINGYTGCKTLHQYFQKTISDVFGKSKIWPLFMPNNLRQLLGLCNSIATKSSQITPEILINKIDNKYDNYKSLMIKLKNSSSNSLNSRVLFCSYQAFNNHHPDIRLSIKDFYKENNILINDFGAISSISGKNLSLGDIIKAIIMIEMRSKSPSIDNNYSIFLEYVKLIYDNKLNKDYLIEFDYGKFNNNGVLITKQRKIVIPDLEGIINESILDVNIHTFFNKDKISSTISYLEPKGLVNDDIRPYFDLQDAVLVELSTLSNNEKEVILSILKYFDTGLKLNESGTDNEITSCFNLYYAWYTWIKNYDTSFSLIHLNMSINPKLSIDELCHIYTKMKNYIDRYSNIRLYEIIKITRFALLQIERTESCKDCEDFKSTLESFNYIYKNMNENNGQLLSILRKITE